MRISDWSSDVCSSDLVDGEEVEYSDSTYMTDLLTRYAVNWLDSIDTDRPFFLYLSHKANHAEFYPAKRHAGKYADLKIRYPPSMFLSMTDTSTVEKPAGFRGPEGPVHLQRSEEHTSELQSIMRISSAVFCLKT